MLAAAGGTPTDDNPSGGLPLDSGIPGWETGRTAAGSIVCLQTMGQARWDARKTRER